MLSLGLIRFFQTFWGLALLLGLAGYSLCQAVLAPSPNRAAPSNSAALEIPVATPSPAPAPPAGYPTPAPLTVFLACNGQDGDAARFYVSSPGGFVVLRLDTDIGLVRTLLAGEPTRFGPGVNLVQTPCMRSAVRDGRVP